MNNTSLGIFSLAASAMTAQSQRMNLTASNLANADTVAGPDDTPYRARHPVFELLPQSGGELGGVRVSRVVEDTAPLRMAYQPHHPLADPQGMVRMSTRSRTWCATAWTTASRPRRSASPRARTRWAGSRCRPSTRAAAS